MNAELSQQITELLTSYPTMDIVIVFGSAAKDQLASNSDIDLAVLTQEPLTSDLKMQIIQKLGDHLGRPIDLIDLKTASPLLTAEILNNGVRLLGSDNAYGKLMSRHIMDYEDFAPLQKRILKERHEQWIKH